MAISRFDLERLMREAFPDSEVRVTSLANDDDHYSIRIVSKVFVGKSKLEQHRMVYDVLDGYDIHALQIQTLVE